MKPRVSVFALAFLALVSCAHVAADWRNKIEFDWLRLDAEGLRGPADGKVAVSYEFAIPDRAACKAEVFRIDPSVQFACGSHGRVGAMAGECLCIGSSHQRDFTLVIRRLAQLPYVHRIVECHFE